MVGFLAYALASRTEATFCFRMRMRMHTVTRLALSMGVQLKRFSVARDIME